MTAQAPSAAVGSPGDAVGRSTAVGQPRLRWLRAAAVVGLLAAVALRFLTRSPLWLDEAQTVEIARRSLPHLFSALREDGSPPLYYLLLHFWMAVFGTSDVAVRALSGICSVATLPLMWLVARRFRLFPGSPWPAVLLLATCPFAVRYGTEARMYSLVLLLVLLGLLAYQRVWYGGIWPTIAAAVVTGALVLTHYWSLFLLAAVGAAAVVAWLRGQPRAARLLLPLIAGCLAFVPWFPSFAYQRAHTGAPWGPPPGVAEPVLMVRGWAAGGVTAPLLLVSYYLLLAIAVAGYHTGRGTGLTFRRPLRRPQLLLLALAVTTMLVGVIASEIQASAYASRYSMIVLAPVLAVAASGFAVLPTRVRTIALCVVCALGLAGSATIPERPRTQAGQVASVLAAASRHDLVVFCPDQLGPAVHRLVPDTGTQLVYPTFGSPAMVDWVDYAQRNADADPLEFAQTALQRASGHTIWLVYATGYPTLGDSCASLLTSFTVARGAPLDALDPHGAFEEDAIAEFLP